MFFVLLLAQGIAELVAVVEICRHGARSPIHFVEEWDNLLVWPEGPGELLASGMRQQFLLGSVMRRKYMEKEKFLNLEYNESEIFVFSSDFNRTIMSAQSQLQGLYPAGTGEQISKSSPKESLWPPLFVKDVEKINEDLKTAALPHSTQLIPIHSDSTIRQYALSSSHACPYYSSLISHKHQMISEQQKIFSQYSDVITTIQQKLNYTQKQAQSKLPNIIDSLISHNFAYGTLPLGFNSTFLARAEKLYDTLKGFLNFEPDLLARFAGTALLNLVVSDLSQSQKTGKKFFVYSAHDTTLSCALAFLELDYSVKPPFASSLIFELRKDGEGLFVEVKYNGKLIKVVGEFERCSFEEFQEYADERSIKGYFERCKETPSEDVLKELDAEYISFSEVKNDDGAVVSANFVAGVLVFASFLTVAYSKFRQISTLQEPLIPINSI